MTEQPIRLTGPDDLAGAIPHLFGYHPTESLAVLCLTGPHRRFAVGEPPVARLADLAPGGGLWCSDTFGVGSEPRRR